ncbi:VacJ family lipoprotein [Agitococcus lubricus]|uniref:Phospholipid-binding lipoprotein MlaA n=1 Tax=Agitococcus lubricus TaxID=1077255 RepID=A0A2T5IX24_9GAMM|nr:VacJ family lipoprotein [Agitococcus lubricus]PTQ88510.1 phospholipid-binding lipoprotein MlaA [Agitococcus lubricus]
MLPRLIPAILTSLMVLPASAWSTENPDPWEKTNRKIYAFNKTADTYFLKPIAKGYRAVTPQVVDDSISRFFDNLLEPLTAINNVLQAKPQVAANDMGRFVVNSVTSLGFADIAQTIGLPKHEEDFGQTFGKWGARSGPYLMLPFLGPSSVRDALAKPFDGLVNPRNLIEEPSVNIGLFVLDVVDTRADIIPLEKIIEGDEYILLRDVYLQRREFAVQDGKVKDSFMDDMDDDSSEESSTSANP